MLALISISFFVAGLLATWFIILRPIYNSEHFQRVRAAGATLLEAFNRFRTMAIAKFLMLASFMVQAYDVITPFVLSSGIDFTPLTSMLPSWAWPLIMLAVSGLFAWLRMKTTAAPAPVAPMFSGARRYEVEG